MTALILLTQPSPTQIKLYVFRYSNYTIHLFVCIYLNKWYEIWILMLIKNWLLTIQPTLWFIKFYQSKATQNSLPRKLSLKKNKSTKKSWTMDARISIHFLWEICQWLIKNYISWRCLPQCLIQSCQYRVLQWNESQRICKNNHKNVTYQFVNLHYIFVYLV